MSETGTRVPDTRTLRTLRNKSRKTYKRNPYSQLDAYTKWQRRVTRSHKRTKAKAKAMAAKALEMVAKALEKDYLDRVRVILYKLTESDDKDKNIEKVMSELNKAGQIYFGNGYINDITDSEYEEPIEALTKNQFRKKQISEIYGEEGEDEEEGENDKNNIDSVFIGNEASFADAFRHAALIDVDTLEIPPIETLSKLAGLHDSDYVFTWDMINKLPSKLARTRFVAIHIDTADLPHIFFPIPGSLPITE